MATSPLSVTYDDQAFTVTPRSGVARYFTELVRSYRTDPSLGIEALTPFRYVVSEHLLELDPIRYRKAPLPAKAQRTAILRPLNRIVSRKGQKRPDILHHTHYAPELLERPAHLRVCTVYDMRVPELFPEVYPWNPHRAKREYVEACDAVLCISQTTKNDLLDLYGTLDKPVVVTHLGASQSFFEAPPKQDGPDYVLHMGQRFIYKNFDVLLRAFNRLAAVRPQLSLLCVGPPFNPDETARLAELGLTDRVRQRGSRRWSSACPLLIGPVSWSSHQRTRALAYRPWRRSLPDVPRFLAR